MAEDTVRVSTLELFFDLVFVFTITQLTTVLVEEPTGRGVAQVVLMLGVIWWMYGGYAWLTNAVPPTSPDRRLLLLGGMAAFLIVALAIPKAFGDDGAAFGIAYAAVVLIHTATFTRSASASIVQAIVRLAPFNLATAALVLAGGIAGGDAQYVLWTLAFLCEWGTPLVNDPGDFDISATHFVERHGLVLIVALGESVVAIGIGAAGLELDAGLAAVAVLALLLTACMWWLYFGGDDEAAERALAAAPQPRRPMLAIYSFGYAQLAMLLGVVAAAAGTKKAIGHPFDALELEPALMLAGGVALFVAAEVAFRTALAIEPRAVRAGAAALALATIPLGLLSAAAQIGALVLILGAALSLERRVRGRRSAVRAPTPAAPRSP